MSETMAVTTSSSVGDTYVVELQFVPHPPRPRVRVASIGRRPGTPAQLRQVLRDIALLEDDEWVVLWDARARLSLVMSPFEVYLLYAFRLAGAPSLLIEAAS